MAVNDETNGLDMILDSCCTAMLEQGATVEACLKRFPGQQSELEPLLRVASSLSRARSVQPSMEFRTAAPQRMQNLIAQRPRSVQNDGRWAEGRSLNVPLSRSRGFGMNLQWAIVLLLCLILFVSSGIMAVSARALPGEALYSVKQAGEALRLSMATSTTERAELRMQYANERLNEALRLSGSSQPQYFEQAMQEYTRLIQSEAAYLDAQSPLKKTEKERLASELTLALEQHERQLNDLIRQAPEALLPTIQAAVKVHHDVLEQVSNSETENQGGLLPVSFHCREGFGYHYRNRRRISVDF